MHRLTSAAHVYRYLSVQPAFFRQLPCWRWYGVSMVGVAELGIREYVWRKEPEEKKHEQLELNLPQAPSRGLHQTAP